MQQEKDRRVQQLEADRRNYVNGSFTVEMSLLMPMILFLIMCCVLACFYYHDKNIIAGAAYETAVIGSTKAREKDGVSEEKLNTLFKERAGRKCILFQGARVTSSVGEEEIHVSATTKKGNMSLAVECSAAVTEPEKYIRDIRRIKK